METSPITVVAVVVTRNPGPSFEDTLASLGAQDCASLPILVLDDGSREPVTARVAQVVPSAFVRRFDSPIGFSAAANESLEMVQGAEFLLFCHDDVALAPDAVRLLCAEARRSDAALVAPKVVAWNAHDRLISLGSLLDRIGSPVGVVEVLELDQGQHDGVREISHAPGAAVLVRADALRALGGYDGGQTDPAVLRIPGELADLDPLFGPDLGEDIDLSWRMKLQGRVISVQPMARVAHLGLSHGSAPVGNRAPTTAVTKQVTRALEANRLRTMVTTASSVRLPFVVLVLFLRSVLHALVPTRRMPRVGFGPWKVLLQSLGSVRRQRKHVQETRVVGDRELLASFQPLGAGTRAAIRADVTTEGALAWNAAERVVAGKSRVGRYVFAGFFVFTVIALFGSRWLIRNGIPSVGQFAPWPSLRGLLGASFSEWRSSGLGVGAPAPPGTYLLAGVSALFVGQAGLAQTVSTLALLPLGAFGVWRLSNLLSSSESRPVPGGGDVAETSSGDREADDDPQGVLSAKVVATAAYLVAPVFYDGLVAGRFDALVAYGLLPWLLHRFLRSRTAPTKSHRAGVVTEAAFLGVPLALMVALAPTLTPLIVVVVLGWSAGSVVAGTPVHAKMFLRRFALGALGAMVLLAPWVGDLLFGSRTHLSLLTGGDQATNSHLRLFDIIRMAGGDVGRSPSSWAFAGLAILPLFVADDARFRNAVRAWVMTLLCVTLIWAVGRGWFPAVIPNEHVMFVAVGLGFALAIGLGVAGVQHDARSRSFGWRQSFGLMASAGIVVLAVPVLLSAGSGRWNLPERTMASDLRWLNDQVTEGGYRVVWLGSPRVLPAAGWRMEPDLAFSASDDGLPSVLGMYGARSTPALQRVLAYLGDARDHRTARLGASLAPYAIRYIVVLERPWENGPLSGIPPDFRSALLGQLDLRQLEVAPGALLLENTEWVPTYAAVPGRPQAVDGSVSVDLSGAQPVLLSSRSEKQLIDDAAVGLDDPEQALENAEARHHDVVAGSELRGRVPPISTLTVAVAADRRWRATGATLDSSPVMLATGTMAFAPTGVRTTDGAPAIGAESSIDVVALEYQSPPVRRFLRVVVGALWLICLLVLIRSRRRHRRSRDLRLLAADRLLQAEDVSSAFGESLGWYADDTDGDDPIVDVPGGVAERVGLRSPQPIGGGRRGASPPATSPIAATTLDDGSVDAPSEASLADALWDTWSRRREERDDPRR